MRRCLKAIPQVQAPGTKKGLDFADIGYVLVSGQLAKAGKGSDLLEDPDVGRLFLGG